MMHTAIQSNKTTYALSRNDLVNLFVGIEICADDITPIAFSKASRWRKAKYGLFVEIVGTGVLYTIRKLAGDSYADIIERDTCYDAINDAWSIYVNG